MTQKGSNEPKLCFTAYELNILVVRIDLFINFFFTSINKRKITTKVESVYV